VRVAIFLDRVTMQKMLQMCLKRVLLSLENLSTQEFAALVRTNMILLNISESQGKRLRLHLGFRYLGFVSKYSSCLTSSAH
jgi:hypothetical protein